MFSDLVIGKYIKYINVFMKEFGPKWLKVAENADTIVTPNNGNKSYSFGKILELNFISYRFSRQRRKFCHFWPFNKSILLFGYNIEINSFNTRKKFKYYL